MQQKDSVQRIAYSVQEMRRQVFLPVFFYALCAKRYTLFQGELK
jgi:hypothetical protein